VRWAANDLNSSGICSHEVAFAERISLPNHDVSRIKDREAAIDKLERIALSNLVHVLRILRHNAANNIRFFRLTSKIIPLTNHEELLDWDYMPPLTEALTQIGDYEKEQQMRLDSSRLFVLLNSPKSDILKNSIRTLRLHH
jgi:UV DNA damage endonuclease